MKKKTMCIARTTAALAAVLAVAAPMTVQPAAQICTIVASAATTPTVSEMENDIRQHPENFFTVSSQKNEDGYYTITDFHRPSKYQNVQLKTLTVPSKIGNKQITRIKGLPSRGVIPAIKDNFLTSIVLSEGIRVLDYDAIVSCPNLRTITLPSSVNELKCDCVQNCHSLVKFNVSSNLLNFERGFLSACPNMKDAWSNKAAYIMIKNGMDIMTVLGSPIIRDAGSSKKPVMNVELESALRSSYSDLEGTELLDTYLRIYCRYLLKNTIGITDSMTFNQKVQKIYGYVIPRVQYDTDAWHYEYENGKIVGIFNSGNRNVSSSGAIFFSDKAICEGYARGLNYLFREAGITSYRVSENDQVLYADGQYHDSGHAFNIISYNNMNFIVDATCRENAFMMNINELKRGHNVEDIGRWRLYDQNNNAVSMNYSFISKVKYALGDLNCDNKVNGNDMSVLLEYNNAGDYEKYSIARRYGLTTSQFECLADADCSGSLNYFADGRAITVLQKRFNF